MSKRERKRREIDGYWVIEARTLAFYLLFLGSLRQLYSTLVNQEKTSASMWGADWQMPGKENAGECKWQLFWTSRWELILPGNTQAWNVPKNMGTERHGGEEWGSIRQIWENVTPRVSLSLPEVWVLCNVFSMGFQRTPTLTFYISQEWPLSTRIKGVKKIALWKFHWRVHLSTYLWQ